MTFQGICSSDVACIESKWGPTLYPQVAGHEIVGRVVRVGSKAEGDLKEGDLVAVGTQVDSVSSQRFAARNGKLMLFD